MKSILLTTELHNTNLLNVETLRKRGENSSALFLTIGAFSICDFAAKISWSRAEDHLGLYKKSKEVNQILYLNLEIESLQFSNNVFYHCTRRTTMPE